MARQKTLKVAALNITTELPHSPIRYSELIKFLSECEGLSGKVAGSDRLILHRLGSVKGKVVHGVFVRYSDIDQNKPWYDIPARKPIVDEDGDPIPQIREGMGANYREVPFVFYTDAHIFVFDCGKISPGQFARALGGILGHDDIKDKFGPLTLTILPTSDALENLLKLPRKAKITIKYTLPNGDVADEEDRIRQRLNMIGASGVEKKIVSHSGRELAPDNTLMAEMNIAKDNGHVQVTCKGPDGTLLTKSTRDTPRIETARYEGNEQYWDAFDAAGKKFAPDHGGGHGPTGHE